MKKQITLLSGLILFSGLNAQVNSFHFDQKLNSFTTEKSISPVVSEPVKALGTTFYTNDFSTPGDWTIDNGTQTGATFGWNVNNTVQSWYSGLASGINSTSGGNCAELSNGNPTTGTQALNVVYTLTSATPIALTNGTNITLEFLQAGARFYDLQEMLISTDGTTFVSVGDNNDKTMLSQSGGSAYTNPTTKRINLASYLSGATQLWIQFRWTTNVPSQATNANVWVTYGWMIDDVKLTTNADYDLAVTENYWGTAGLGYYQIPTTQIAPIEFTANVLNEGISNMTNVQYNVSITSSAFSGTSPGVTIAPMASDSLVLSSTFTPSAVGAYAVDRSITATDADDISSNNTFAPLTFNVTNYIYARDNNTPSGYTTNGTDPFETGNLYDIWTEQEVKGVNVRFATGTPAGTEVYASIYSIQNGEFVLELQSDVFALTNANLNNSNYTIYLGQPLTLLANNTYLVTVGTYMPSMRVANGGSSVAQTSFMLDGNDIAANTLYYQLETPMVRLNFDPVLAIEANDLVSDLTVAPNPFTAATSIQFDLKTAEKVSLVVTDLAGRVVYRLAETQLSAGNQSIEIDGSAFNAGVYTYTLTVGTSTTTNRIVKK
jgi:hypothetical protein